MFFKMIKHTLRNIFVWFWTRLPLVYRVYLFDEAAGYNVGYLDYHEEKIKIEASSPIIYHRLTTSCKKEPGTINWIEKYFKQNDVFYDIGANIGAYSFVANVKTKGRIKIYALEPGLNTYDQLCKNICLNAYQNSIIPLNIALSSRTGFQEFVYQSLVGGAAENRGLEEKPTAQSRKTEIFSQIMATFTLDYLVKSAKLDSPNHIKVDVDGHEYAVLSGARETLLSRSMKTIQIEVDEESSKIKRIIQFLGNIGYVVVRKNRHGVGNICDYVFVKNKYKSNRKSSAGKRQAVDGLRIKKGL